MSLWICTIAYPCWRQQLSLAFQLCKFLFVPLFNNFFLRFLPSLDLKGTCDTLLQCLL